MQVYKITNPVVIDYSVRELCPYPYPNHPKGCPTYGKKSTCPPHCLKVEDYFDLSQGLWIVWIDFDFTAHRHKMKKRHLDWSQRQIDCCLYWQGTANKMLREAVADVEYYLEGRGNWETAFCPEAMGVNVTATMKSLGIVLEWPPETLVRKVAIIGIRKN